MLRQPSGHAVTAVAGTLLLSLLAPAEEALAGEWGPEDGVTCIEGECQVVASTRGRHAAEGQGAGERVSGGSASGTVPRGRSAGSRLAAGAGDSGRREQVYETGSCRVTVPERGLTEIDCSDGEKPKAKGAGQSAGELGRLAVERLRLPSPVIRLSPSLEAVQVVRVPTWLWVDGAVWRSVSETAEVPGVSVTATARPVRVVWSMGEGGEVVCTGPGTPWDGSLSADAASPDCGYTYFRSSVGEAEGVFTVSAAVVWDVVWEGGGESGRVPGLVSVDEVAVTVDEIQALVR